MSDRSVDVWMRYFARREAEEFGATELSLSGRRAQVLAYVREKCPEAWVRLTAHTVAA